jgi:hypothetical protein
MSRSEEFHEQHEEMDGQLEMFPKPRPAMEPVEYPDARRSRWKLTDAQKNYIDSRGVGNWKRSM